MLLRTSKNRIYKLLLQTVGFAETTQLGFLPKAYNFMIGFVATLGAILDSCLASNSGK
jgi:hypothetical protein